MMTVVAWPAATIFFFEKLSSGSPAFTCAFFSAKTVKPSPFISTVSTPTWMRISAPSSPTRPTAWKLGAPMALSVPETGA